MKRILIALTTLGIAAFAHVVQAHDYDRGWRGYDGWHGNHGWHQHMFYHHHHGHVSIGYYPYYPNYYGPYCY